MNIYPVEIPVTNNNLQVLKSIACYAAKQEGKYIDPHAAVTFVDEGLYHPGPMFHFYIQEFERVNRRANWKIVHAIFQGRFNHISVPADTPAFLLTYNYSNKEKGVRGGATRFLYPDGSIDDVGAEGKRYLPSDYPDGGRGINADRRWGKWPRSTIVVVIENQHPYYERINATVDQQQIVTSE